MKKIFWLAAVFVMGVSVIVAEDSPIGSGQWHFNKSQTLNGRYFMGGFWGPYADSWREQDGYAVVEGFGSLHYWLYDTITYHGGNAADLYNLIIPKWVENMGYVIDYDNIKVYNPNHDLATSVRALMQQRGCDVSVALVHARAYDYVVINEWFKSKGTYKTTIYYLLIR
ncbi:MAG: hypothetical protein Pg6C_10540 [Treponemataceae bacterium]|nr:MAG: hypothetical protein Pg6C_10540 [Treponemataceae bacterium]